MNLIESILSAFGNVYNHKMRSTLTMLGIIIGIASVIMITSLGAGVKDTIFSSIDSINKTMIQVWLMNYDSYEDLMTLDDAEALKSIDNIKNVSVMIERDAQSIQLREPTKQKKGSIAGIDENYRLVETVKITQGRFISRNDVVNHSMVGIISEQTAMEAFGRIDCIGEKLEVESWSGTYKVTVVGVIHLESIAMGMGSSPLTRNLVLMPITSFSEMIYSDDTVDFIAVVVKDGTIATDTAKKITDLLNLRHNKENGYYAESMASSLNEMDTVLNAVTGFVAFVAAISLFVGGVGVMNIMLVTVTERTREIGIRKSLGATNNSIKLQFVMEAMILTSLGGIAGIVFGHLGALGIGSIITMFLGSQFTPITNASALLLAVGISSLVGIIFGVYPAGKAAKLNPIEALRYE